MAENKSILGTIGNVQVELTKETLVNIGATVVIAGLILILSSFILKKL